MAPIHYAAMNGDLKEIKRLIRRKPRLVNHGGQYGWTPLHYASLWGKVEVAAWLLGHGAHHIDQTTKSGQTACLLACEEGDLAVVELLLREGADPSIPQRGYGTTPLMAASRSGFVDIVQCLLHHPQTATTLNHRDRRKKTALFHACMADDAHMGVARLLLEAGADPTLADEHGVTPLTALMTELRRYEGGGPNACEEKLPVEWERRYILTKARHLHDASHDHDVSQALALHQPSSSSSSSPPLAKRARVKAPPTYLSGRLEKGEPLPMVEVAVADEGGRHCDRKVKEVDEGLLVRVVLEYVLCGGLKGDLFVELMEEMLGKTGYRKDRTEEEEAAAELAKFEQEIRKDYLSMDGSISHDAYWDGYGEEDEEEEG